MSSHFIHKKMLPIVILAGGIASRLRPITERIPKALVKIAGEPFIVHQLRLLKKHSFSKVVLSVGYKGEMIEKIIGNGRRWGLDVRYSYDGPTLLGTGGALKKALPLLDDAFFVLYGDSYLECKYSKVQAAFFKDNKSSLLTIFHNAGAWDKSNIEYHEGKIKAYEKEKRTPQMQYIDYGLAILRKEVFGASASKPKSFDLAALYKYLIKQGDMAGYEVKQRFYEVGSFEGLEEFRCYLERKRIKKKG